MKKEVNLAEEVGGPEKYNLMPFKKRERRGGRESQKVAQKCIPSSGWMSHSLQFFS